MADDEAPVSLDKGTTTPPPRVSLDKGATPPAAPPPVITPPPAAPVPTPPPAAPAAPPPPPPPPAPAPATATAIAPRPARTSGVTLSRNALIALAAAAVVLVVGIGVAIGLATGTDSQGSQGSQGAAPGAAPGTDPTQPPATDTAESTTPSETPVPSITASPAGPSSYMCWNGTVKRTLAGCGSPYSAAHSATPLAGLNWVFRDRGPRAESHHAECEDIGLSARSLHRQCTFDYQGSSVCINWSQFHSYASGRADYDRIGASTRTTRPGGGVVIQWGPAPHGSNACEGRTYKAARMIVDERWGLSAYSYDPDAAVAALNYFGEFRRHDQWNGIPRD